MSRVYLYIILMAVVTYLIRALPLTLIRKEIKSRFIKSFLYYVPYATLAAMTFPAILYGQFGCGGEQVRATLERQDKTDLLRVFAQLCGGVDGDGAQLRAALPELDDGRGGLGTVALIGQAKLNE